MPAQSQSTDGQFRRGTAACPGLFRIVPARDGGLCRVKIPLGALRGAQSRALAEAASRFGNGVIEVTNRANLQLRGIGVQHAEAVADRLIGAKLGPALPEGDDIRNVMVNPTAGIDSGQILDVRPLALALLDRIQADEACRALSPKFSFLIDGGEDVAILDHPHDVWLAASHGENMAIGFAGCPSDERAGVIRREAAVETIIDAARLFHEMAAGRPAITRLRHLSRDDFIRRLDLPRDRSGWRRRTARRNPVGIFRQRGEGLSYIGAIPPLGRLTPAMLIGAAEIAARRGEDELRLTPWQGLLVPSIQTSRAALATKELEALGFVCNDGDPLVSIIACAGSPGCSSGHADTKADAAVLAQRIPGASGTVHLTGCEKSCASAAVADRTLVAVAPGRYDLYAKGAGETRFGRKLSGAATVEQVARILQDRT